MFRTFSEHLVERTDETTILNTLTIAGGCITMNFNSRGGLSKYTREQIWLWTPTELHLWIVNLYYWISMCVLYTSGGSCRIVEGERHGEGVSEWWTESEADLSSPNIFWHRETLTCKGYEYNCRKTKDTRVKMWTKRENGTVKYVLWVVLNFSLRYFVCTTDVLQ